MKTIFNSMEELEEYVNAGVIFTPFTKPIVKVKQTYQELLAYIKKWRIENKEELKEYQEYYYKLNNEKIKKISNEWYKERKDEINKKCLCDCGRYYTFQNKARHEQTKLHIKGNQ
jgi:hypothetical protein